MDEQAQKNKKRNAFLKVYVHMSAVRFNKLTTVTIVINNLSSIAVTLERKQEKLIIEIF